LNNDDLAASVADKNTNEHPVLEQSSEYVQVVIDNSAVDEIEDLHDGENVEHISEEIIKNAIEVVFVENVVDGSASDDSLEDDEQDKKLTQSQREFMGGTYRNEYDEDEYGDDDVEIDDDVYDE
jgi:hypothetical protein